MLRGFVDTTLANRKLFVPPRSATRPPSQPLHIKGHDGDHEEMEQQFRRILGNRRDPRP